MNDRKVLNYTVRGKFHLNIGLECQDNSLSYSDDKLSLAIVCDGHGSDDYVRSAVGSEIACDVAKSAIIKFVNETDEEKLEYKNDELINILEKNIIFNWRKSVENHSINNPFSANELSKVSSEAKESYLKGKVHSAYGTTLIAAFATESYFIAIQIGDGSCTVIDENGSFLCPVPDDEKCKGHVTTSLCEDDVINNFRYYYTMEIPTAVFICTDGIDNIFSNNREAINNFYKKVLCLYKDPGQRKFVPEEVRNFINKLSAREGSDDISLAYIIDCEKNKELEFVKEFNYKEADKEKTDEEGTGEKINFFQRLVAKIKKIFKKKNK